MHQGVVNLLPKGAFFRLHECLESSFCIHTSVVFPAYIMCAFCENSSRKEIFKEDTKVGVKFLPLSPLSAPIETREGFCAFSSRSVFQLSARAFSA